MWLRVARVRTDISEELIASISKVERLSEVKTFPLPSNLSTLRRNLNRFFNIKLSLYSALEAYKVIERRGSHVFRKMRS
jgi:hypothetical protein